MRAGERGFGYQVDAMAIIASSGVLIAIALPAVKNAGADASAVGITVGLLVLSAAIGTGIALMRGWHGLGFTDGRTCFRKVRAART